MADRTLINDPSISNGAAHKLQGAFRHSEISEELSPEIHINQPVIIYKKESAFSTCWDLRVKIYIDKFSAARALL